VIFVPVYPLAPEAHQPVQAIATRAYLVAHPAVNTARMAVGGDPAGGTIALGLRMAINASVIQPAMIS
jgi:acetyl esterase/lipase